MRTYYCISSLVEISQKEIVFRLLWEISKLSKSDWEKAFVVAFEFLEYNKMANSLVLNIVNDLLEEITFLDKNRGRAIHNPFIN